MKHFLSLLAALVMTMAAFAQVPTVDPVGTYYSLDSDGKEETGDLNSATQNAPLRVVFAANPTVPDDYKSDVWYEWTIWKTDAPDNILLRRNDQDFEYEFTESGSYAVRLRATFYHATNSLLDYDFPQDDEDPKLIQFTIAESKLEFPNAFSPNDDGKNDVLKAKDNFKSIVEFHAAVFNRWGNKLYSWDDVHQGWDGKQGGRTVKDGVYFLVVKAKGGDGIDYNIKKAINVLTNYNEDRDGTSQE